MKKICLLILAIVLMFNILVFPAFAEASLTEGPIITTTDIEAFCEQLVYSLNHQRGLNLTIRAVKELVDFAGNQYFVLECDPIGYCIIHGETKEIVELATESPLSLSRLSKRFDLRRPHLLFLRR